MNLKDSVVVEVEERQPGSSNVAKRMRRAGRLPAVLYGGGRETRPITVDPRLIVTILRSGHGQNTLLNLKVGDGRQQPALIHAYDVDPLSHKLVHADFLRIALDVEIEVAVPIEIVGEALGVRLDHGILDQVVREIQVKCLPADIPDTLPVDVTELGLGGTLHVSDLRVPDSVEVLADPDQTIVNVAAPTVQVEEVEEVEEALIVEAEEPEVIGKGGAEGESDEEG